MDALTPFPAPPLLIANAADDEACPHEALERLQAQLGETERQYAAIGDEGVDLYAAINRLVLAYADRHGCEASQTMEEIDTAISLLVDDAQGPSWRRKTRLEDEISFAQEALS